MKAFDKNKEEGPNVTRYDQLFTYKLDHNTLQSASAPTRRVDVLNLKLGVRSLNFTVLPVSCVPYCRTC